MKENIDYVICQICGKQFKQLQYRHLKFSHNITIEEYKVQFPNAILQPECVKRFGDANHSRKQEVKDKISKALVGRNIGFGDPSKKNKHSSESKKLISQNNAMLDIESREKVSIGVKKSYESNPELLKLRSEKFIETMSKESWKEIMYDRDIWIRPELKPALVRYRDTVRELTKQNYKKFFYEIKDADKRSRQHHLDHKLSVHDGFYNNIPPKIIAHYMNLEILDAKVNEQKNYKSSITIDKLKELIKNSKDPI